MFYFNTSKPQRFYFLQNTSCIRNRRSSRGGGVRTLCTLPLGLLLLIVTASFSLILLIYSLNQMCFISSPAKKNCNLDPMPTKLVAEFLDVSASSYLNGR